MPYTSNSFKNIEKNEKLYQYYCKMSNYKSFKNNFFNLLQIKNDINKGKINSQI